MQETLFLFKSSNLLIEQISFIKKQIRELEEKIVTLLKKSNQVVTSIPGVGEILGAIIISENGDINRFCGPSNLVAFAGLDAKIKQSGKFSSTKTKISK